jgi:hypothetical protein
VIVDCFTFFNEFDVLELRLRTLGNVVDRFVLCEAPFTFRGDPKPLAFAEHAERFAPWIDRIRVIAYAGPPDENPWRNEWGQRDHLLAGLHDCEPDDLILIGDCDEIPDPAFVAQRPADGAILVHTMILMRGYANRADFGGAFSWPGTRALTYSSIRAYDSLSNVRQYRGDALTSIESGWHFSSLGGGAAMEQKMRTYSHAEYDIPYFNDRRRLDTFYRSDGGADDATELPLEQLPAPLREEARYAHFLWKRLDGLDGEHAARLEHAHGCLAYVPADAPGVFVLTDRPIAFHDAGTARFGAAFGGTFAETQALVSAAAPPAWIVVDALERHPAGTLAALAATGAHLVVFATNARSRSAYAVVLAGGAFAPGRALGRAEIEHVIATAGLTVVSSDRVANRTVPWVWLPPETGTLYNVTVAGFHFAELSADALHDFQSDAFVWVLAPRADTNREMKPLERATGG